MWAEVRGDPDVVVFERRIPDDDAAPGLTVALLAIGVVIGRHHGAAGDVRATRADVRFETVSALGTVGCRPAHARCYRTRSQFVVIVLMLLGRVGPITLFAALVLRERDRLYRHPEERPIIG